MLKRLLPIGISLTSFLWSTVTLAQGGLYDRPAEILGKLGSNFKATFVNTDSLKGSESSFEDLCTRIRGEGYNVVFVNVLARGYFLGRPGLLLSYGKGEKQLIPGHPGMKVSHPILEMRKYCSSDVNPVYVIPWIEYNTMADMRGGLRDLGEPRGKGFKETDTDPNAEPGYLPYYFPDGTRTESFESVTQSMYPPFWYLKVPTKEGERIYVSKPPSTARWLDIRLPETKELMMNFSRKLTEFYGPLQNWDRARYPKDPALGLKEEIKDPYNAHTQFIQRLGSELKAAGGALWVTVAANGFAFEKTPTGAPELDVQDDLFGEWDHEGSDGIIMKKADKKPEGIPDGRGFINKQIHLQHGQHWTRWARDVQVYLPMTYYGNLVLFQREMEEISKQAQSGGFKFVPLVGLTKSYEEMQRSPNKEILQSQRDWLRQNPPAHSLGYADWFFK